MKSNKKNLKRKHNTKLITVKEKNYNRKLKIAVKGNIILK